MRTFREVLERSVELYGGRLAFTLKNKEGEYTDISFVRFNEEVRSLATEFLARGYGQTRIAIIGKNSYGWFLANAATQLVGGVSVPLDKDLKYGEFELSIRRSQAKILFYDKNQKAMAEQVLAEGTTDLEVIYPLYDTPDGATVFALRDLGKDRLDHGDRSIDDVVIDPDVMAMMLFTSGTTSQSKIVMLSQNNVCANITAMIEAEPLEAGDTNLALLPYHHTYGGTGQWVMIAAGIRTVYCDGLKYIQKNMKEYEVSVFVGVPLIIEQMYKKVLKTAEKSGMDGRLRRFSKITRALNKVHIDVRRRIFHGVLEAFGGKLHFVVLGASAADPECIQGFNDFGVLCVQGYGLTETSPVLTSERPGLMRKGSVGVPLPGVAIMIDEPDEEGIGEIIVRGENVMLGYYEDEEATNAVLRDGWFHTGDLGRVDKDGYLFITGRKKNVIVLRNGKNVFPEELEAELGDLPYMTESFVTGVPNNGDEKDLVVALRIGYDAAYFEGKTPEEIEARIWEDVEKINDRVPAYKRIKRIYPTDEPMEKTSTGKIRRFKEVEKMLGTGENEEG